MKTIILFILTIPSVLLADDFQCEDTGMVTKHSTYKGCGVGVASTEALARDMAFYNVTEEFKKLCKMSESCTGRELVIESRRTECVDQSTDYSRKVTCHRLIFFHID